MQRFEDDVVISGVGRSPAGRRLGRDALDLAVEACLDAVADAGLELEQVKGLATSPGSASGYGAPGFQGPSIAAVQDVLRLDLDWYSSTVEGGLVLGAVIDGMMAVATGLANHVLVYRAVTEATAAQAPVGGGRDKRRTPQGDDEAPWLEPYAANQATVMVGLYASAYLHEFGYSRDALAAVVGNARRNAAANPAAIYADPITREQYADARMIADPLCLYDCDFPTDGAVAVVLSRADARHAGRGAAVAFEAVGTARSDRPSWGHRSDYLRTAGHDAARQMWARTDVASRDVTLAHLYDGFSILVLGWLEALGFCGRGDAGAFVQDSAAIGRDAGVYLNSDGGQLTAGRLVGYGHLFEACLQLRGEAGLRQQDNARFAVVAGGGGPVAQTLLLRRS